MVLTYLFEKSYFTISKLTAFLGEANKFCQASFSHKSGQGTALVATSMDMLPTVKDQTGTSLNQFSVPTW
jgi:hypothetical protein